MTQLRAERLEAPAGGLDSDSSPEVIKKGFAPDLKNFLTGYPGLVRLRGPLIKQIPFLGAGATKICGAWHHGDKLLIGARLGHATETREPWVAPYRKAATASLLAKAGTTMYEVNLLTGGLSSVAVTRTTQIGPSYCRVGRWLYGVSYDSTDDDAVGVLNNVMEFDGIGRGGFIRRTRLLRFDTRTPLAAPVVYPDQEAPHGMVGIVRHNQRLWTLGGPTACEGAVGSRFFADWTDVADGARDHSPNILWYSRIIQLPDIDATNGFLIAQGESWQDDINTADDNKITVDSEDPGDFLVGAGKVGRNLAIFKRNSIHVLYGDKPSTYTVRQFAEGIGCIDPRSIVELAEGVFFMSQHGYHYFDGAQILDVSQRIHSNLLDEALTEVGDSGRDGGVVQASRLSNTHIALTVSYDTFELDAGARVESTPSFSALYDVRSRGWSHFSSEGLETGFKPTRFLSTDTRAVCTDDTQAWEMSQVPTPEAVAEDQRGFDGDENVLFILDGTTVFDGVAGTLRNPGPPPIEAFVGGTFTPIPALWKSRLLRLATPFGKAQLHRIGIDYRFEPEANVTEDIATGWLVTVKDGDNNVVVPQYELPGQVNPSTQYQRKRHRVDTFAEVDDLYVEIKWAGPELAIAVADILDVYVEYQTTRERH